jgi:hypothetical protein
MMESQSRLMRETKGQENENKTTTRDAHRECREAVKSLEREKDEAEKLVSRREMRRFVRT